MKFIEVKKLSLETIVETLRGSDLKAARSALSFVIGSLLDVSGTVRKVVKREGQFKLMIEAGEVPGFIVFADCLQDAENLTKTNIRKGSFVFDCNDF